MARTCPLTDPHFEVQDGGGADRGEGWAPLTHLDSNQDPYLDPRDFSLVGAHSGHCKIGIGRNILDVT